MSKAHLGVEDQDLEYEKRLQLSPYVLYLSLTSDLKLVSQGQAQVPTRWIDQGAVKQACCTLLIIDIIAGITEVKFKEIL